MSPGSDAAAERAEALLAALFAPFDRLAPGSAGTTRRALALLPAPGPGATIVDMGAGTGAAAAVLAAATPARVVALDRLPALLARCPVGVLPVAADMLRPPFADGSIDVVWSEGAAYAVGFDAALAAWRRLLRPGGHVVLSDAVWTTADPPAAARDFWQAEYPGMTTAAARRDSLAAAGFVPVGDFAQPASDWAAYYDAVAARLPGFLATHPGDEAAGLAAGMAEEAELWRRHGDAWAYHLFVARRSG